MRFHHLSLKKIEVSLSCLFQGTPLLWGYNPKAQAQTTKRSNVLHITSLYLFIYFLLDKCEGLNPWIIGHLYNRIPIRLEVAVVTSLYLEVNDGALVLVHFVPNELKQKKKEKKEKKRILEDFNIDGNDWLCEFHWSRLAFVIESYDALKKITVRRIIYIVQYSLDPYNYGGYVLDSLINTSSSLQDVVMCPIIWVKAIPYIYL